MRLFIAVQLPDGIREKLGVLSKEIEQDGIRPVEPKNMHITLRFIGEMPEERISEIKERLERVTFKGFTCSAKGIGVFPNENYIRVVWAGVESGGALENLAKDVSGALQGLPGDGRFSAHLTIARVKKKVDIKGFLEKHRGDGFGDFDVSEFELVQSVLGSDGPEYTTLAAYRAEDV